MAAILTLESGEPFRSSSLAFGGMLLLTARKIDPKSQELRIWLADLSQRTAPFMDWDIRELSERDRRHFWTAAHEAYNALIKQFGADVADKPNSHSANCLKTLLAHYQQAAQTDIKSQSITTKLSGYPIDFKELWLDHAELQKLLNDKEL